STPRLSGVNLNCFDIVALLKVGEKREDSKMPVIPERIDSSFYISKLLYRKVFEQENQAPWAYSRQKNAS
ncbi:MAG: hypothetical protein RSF79_30380, partial [Janthinobacterium sp.]